ncbi:MAG: hypothetical protein ABSF83_10960 [Nitrososphaerales archaeon]|jgi:transcription initiation factor TFIIB
MSSRDRPLPDRPSLGEALGELRRFSEALGLPATITEEAARICRMGVTALRTRRSPTHLAAASLYAACRERALPTTLDDVAAATGVDRNGIARCYRSLVTKLDFEVPPVGAAEYIDRVAAKAGADQYVRATALEILSRADRVGVAGGTYPIGLTASALYMAAVLEGNRLTQRDVAAAAGVTEATIQKEFQRLRKILDPSERVLPATPPTSG